MQSLNTSVVANELVSFLEKTFTNAHFSSAVIALSGGVDSSASCALAVAALGKNNVYPLLLPYGDLNSQGTTDAWLVITLLGIPGNNVTHIDIQPLVDPIIATGQAGRELKFATTTDTIRRGNIMARVRMTLLFDQAKKRNALVVGTENKTEHLLGYYTRFGDEASDIEPLRNLYKTQVYVLARYLGIPEIILTKLPSAGLWEGQTDEGEFGFTYKEADEILSLIVDEGITESVARSKLRYNGDVIEKVIKKMKDNAFKQHLPILPGAK